MAPGCEIHAGAFECKSARNSRTDSPTRACHEYTFVFDRCIHPFRNPHMTAMVYSASRS